MKPHQSQSRRSRDRGVIAAVALCVAALVCLSGCLRIDVLLLDKRTRLEVEILGVYQSIGRTVALSPTPQALGITDAKPDAAALDEAVQGLEAALNELGSRPLPPGESQAVCEARLRYNLFSALSQLGKADDARVQLAAAREIAEARRMYSLLWKIQYEEALLDTEDRLAALQRAAMAQYLSVRGDPDEKEPEAIPLVLLTNTPPDGRMRRTLLGRLVAALIEEEDAEGAGDQVETFAALETSLFFSSLPNPPHPDDAPKSYAALLERRKDLIERHTKLLLCRPQNEEVLKSAQAELDEAIKAYQEAQGEIEYARFETLLAYYFTFESLAIADVGGLGLLGNDGAYLRYLLNGRTLHIWLGLPESEDEEAEYLVHRAVEVSDEFLRAVAAINADPLSWTDEHVRTLSKALIEPIAAQMDKTKVRRIYVAPGRDLLAAPWPALNYGGGALCEHAQIAFATGALELMMVWDRPPIVKRSALFCPATPGGAGLREVLDDSFKEVSIIPRDEATPQGILAAARYHNVVHIGYPYYLYAARPWQSYIAFAQPESLHRTRLSDLASLDFSGQVLSLSNPSAAEFRGDTCDRPLMRTVDVLTSAGVPTILVALPTSRTDGGSTLWQDFYQALAAKSADQGQALVSPGEALRRAQAKALQANSPSKEWALVKLFGHLGPSSEEVADYLETAMDNIEAARWAAEQRKSWKDVLRLSKEKADLISAVPGQPLEERLSYHRRAAADALKAFSYRDAAVHGREWVRLAREDGDKDELARALRNLGVYCSNAGDAHAKEATKSIREAAKTYDDLGREDEAIAATIELAHVQRRFLQFKESIGTFEAVLARVRQRGDRELEAQIQYDIGTVYLRRLNDYLKAEERFAVAMDVARAANAERLVAKCVRATAVCRDRQGDFATAAERLDSALQLALQIGDKELQAEAHLERANVAWFQADYSDALDQVRASLTIAEQIRNDSLASCVGHVYDQLGRALAAQRDGDFEAFEKELKAGFDLSAKIGDPVRFAVFNLLAGLYVADVSWLAADVQSPVADMTAAFKQDREEAVSKRDNLRTRALNTQGLIYWTLNDYEKALAELKSALSLAGEIHQRKKIDVREDIASHHNNIGLIHRDQGQYETAISHFEKALRTDEALMSRWGQAYSHKNLGMTYRRMGMLNLAKVHLARSAGLAREIGDTTSLVKALYSLANVYADQGEPDNAKQQYEEALSLSQHAGIREIQWRSLWGLGRLAQSRGDSQEARTRLAQAIEVVEGMRAAIRIEEYRNGFVANKLGLYEDMVLLLLGEGEKEEAFHYAERARARSFIDLLGTKLSSVVRPEPVTAQQVLHILLESQGKAKGQAASSNVALVEYFVAKDEIIIWVLRGREVHVVSEGGDALRKKALELRLRRKGLVSEVSAGDIDTITVADALSECVLEYRRLIQGIEDVDDYPNVLHETLIAPIGKHIQDADSPANDCPYVCVVPHGVLHYLPFATLHDGSSHLVERHALFYAPSASVLQFTMKARTARAAKEQLRVLAIGNPYLGTRAMDLAFAENEVESIPWNFAIGNPGWATTQTATPKTGGDVRTQWRFPRIKVVTREEATESWVQKNISKYDVIHIASHGEFDSANPLFSCLRLAEDRAARLDGRLDVQDVFGFELKADLVILSACQSGLGKVEKGDEVIGLNRAFFYAGTRAIVSSLWRVSDIATGIMIKHFYRRYGDSSKADSLRQAQLHVKNDPRRSEYRHPAYWAAFTLVGDYR